MRRKNSRRLGISVIIAIFLFFVFILTFLLNVGVVSAIRINEVMSHNNNSFGDEWIELYNEENSNLVLNGWKIADKLSNDTINLNISANGFAIIVDSSIGCENPNLNIPRESCIELTTIGSGLNDADEIIYFYNNSSLVDTFSWNTNIKSSGNSWQFYNSAWQACIPTPVSENLCQSQAQNQSQQNQTQSNQTSNQTQQNQTAQNQTQQTTNQTQPPQQTTNQTNNQAQQNQTQQTTQNQTTNQTSPYIVLNYDYENAFNEEINVELYAYNLNDVEYDVKIFIYFKNSGNVISNTYNENENKWKSSVYYINKAFSGTPVRKNFKLEIQGDAIEFRGEANISVKLRKSRQSNIYIEYIGGINITDFKSKESGTSSITGEAIDLNKQAEVQEQGEKTEQTVEDQSIIKLNTGKVRQEGETGKVLFLSETEKIKKYAIYAFAIFLIFLIIVLFKYRKM